MARDRTGEEIEAPRGTPTPRPAIQREPGDEFVAPTPEQETEIRRAIAALKITLAIPYSARRDPEREAGAMLDRLAEAFTLSPEARRERALEQSLRYAQWRRAHPECEPPR